MVIELLHCYIHWLKRATNCSDSCNLLCCIQFSHAEFKRIHLHYVHPAPRISFFLRHVGARGVIPVLHNYREEWSAILLYNVMWGVVVKNSNFYVI